MSAAVLLLDPKFPHNVGAALRSCAILGATELFWTGDRVPGPNDWPEGARLPREERGIYERFCAMHWLASGVHAVDFARDLMTDVYHHRGPVTPVCVEIRPGAQDMRLYTHPRHALYVFGPEDADIDKGMRMACHEFVEIPTAYEDMRSPLNLSHAVAITLYSRLATLPGGDVVSRIRRGASEVHQR